MKPVELAAILKLQKKQREEKHKERKEDEDHDIEIINLSEEHPMHLSPLMIGILKSVIKPEGFIAWLPELMPDMKAAGADGHAVRTRIAVPNFEETDLSPSSSPTASCPSRAVMSLASSPAVLDTSMEGKSESEAFPDVEEFPDSQGF